MVEAFQVYWEAKSDHDYLESLLSPEDREKRNKAKAAATKATIAEKMR